LLIIKRLPIASAAAATLLQIKLVKNKNNQRFPNYLTFKKFPLKGSEAVVTFKHTGF